jgi:hypothetical protein
MDMIYPVSRSSRSSSSAASPETYLSIRHNISIRIQSTLHWACKRVSLLPLLLLLMSFSLYFPHTERPLLKRTWLEMKWGKTRGNQRKILWMLSSTLDSNSNTEYEMKRWWWWWWWYNTHRRKMVATTTIQPFKYLEPFFSLKQAHTHTEAFTSQMNVERK